MDLIREELQAYIDHNLQNTGTQYNVKTKGGAWINPINYKIEELVPCVAWDNKQIPTFLEKYTIPNTTGK